MTPAQRGFQVHAAAWTATNVFLLILAAVTGMPFLVVPIVAGGWGIGLATHATAVYTKAPRDDELEPGDEQPQLGYRS